MKFIVVTLLFILLMAMYPILTDQVNLWDVIASEPVTISGTVAR